MAPKSLVELSLEACHRHISSLTSFGDPYFMIPREILHNLLSKINDASQLRTIEINSPHILPETPHFWKRLIAREFPGESRENNYTPKNPFKWYKIYERYVMERRASQKEAEERMRLQFRGLQEKKDSRVTQVVEQKLLPRPGRRARGGFENSTGQLTFGRGSRTSNALQKARRQASEYRLMRGPLAKPCRTNPTGTVKKAPDSMVNERRIAAQPTFRSSSLKLPPADQGISGMEGANGPPKYISDSSDDEADLLDDSEFPPKMKFKKAPVPSVAPQLPRNTTAAFPPNTASEKTTRRPGLLNNAPKPKNATSKATIPAPKKPESKTMSAINGSSSSSARPVEKTAVSVPRKSDVTQRDTPFLGSNRATSSRLSTMARADSPPLASAGAPLSPPISSQHSPQRNVAKKRKAVGIFMPTKKRKN